MAEESIAYLENGVKIILLAEFFMPLPPASGPTMAE